jgi:Zn-dependent peptidase ImmA (M78 family)
VLAARVRGFLGVAAESQLSARDDFAALRLWVDALHAKSVYVLQRRLDDPSVRAFSMVKDGHALIVISTKDTAYARAFSAVHEYAHIMLRTAGVCDLDDHSTVERFCNQIAAGVLLPTALLDVARAEFGSFTGDAAADDERLIRMSRRLRVSQAALLIRLRDLARLDQRAYDALEARRSARRSPPGKRGGTYYGPAINRVSRRFARNVVGAWDEGELDRQEASTLLGIGEHIAGRFREELLKGEADV